jgi:hypothetical protein
MSRSFKPDFVPAAAADQAESSNPSPGRHSPYYLVIDHRFRVPIFVFLEVDPRIGWLGADPGSPVLGVTLELAAPPASMPVRERAGVRCDVTIGRDPQRPDRFREFRSDRHVRAAGFVLIEPRYVGANWETYLSVFRPEGDRRLQSPHQRCRTGVAAH